MSTPYLLIAALEAAADGIVITDRDGTILWVNPAYTRLTGYTTQEAIGNNPRLLKSGKHDQAFYQDLWETILSGRVWAKETINRRKDGSLYTEAQTITPVRDERGDIRYFIAIKQDITDRKQAEEALRASEARKGAMFESALDGIITMDHNGRITEFNPAAEQMFGYTRDDVMGKELAKVIIPPPLRESHCQRLARYLATGEGRLLGKRLEMTAMRADGTEFSVELTITRIPIDGPPTFTGFVRDVTQRKQAEEARARLIAILEATTDFVGICDAARNPLYINAGGRKMVGLEQEDAIARYTIRERHPEWARARIEGEGIPTAIREGVWRSESALLHRDGREIPVSQVIIAHKGPDGTLEYLSTIARDITEQKQFEASLQATVEARTQELRAANSCLEEASSHKSAFLANMSHEFRTPLNAILGFAELLRDQTYGPLNAKQARYVSHIHQSGQHLLGLVNDLLDLSKVEAGRLELRPESIALLETLVAAVEEIRPLADQKRLTLMLRAEATPVTLHADLLRFKQILYNLLSNAVKFTPEGGRITVTVRPGSSEGSRLDPKPYTLYPGDFVEIAVVDTGIGITAEDLPKLFQPFTQLELVRARQHQGTGLGLALTKHLVELHGGQILVASEGEARGTTFTVRLPIVPPRRVAY